MTVLTALNVCPSHQPMMDRNKSAELPKLQCGFIDFVCTFVYKVIMIITFLLTEYVHYMAPVTVSVQKLG